MSSTRLLTKTIVVALAFVCVLSVTLLPSASANYGEVRSFGRFAPPAFPSAKIHDVYWDTLSDPPGRVCTIFTIGYVYGFNIPNAIDSTEDLAIGTIGIYITRDEGFDHKTARDFWENFDSQLWLGEVEIELDKTPMRYYRFIDEDGHLNERWEWRFNAAFKKGELVDIIDFGWHEYRQDFILDDDILFSTEDGNPPYWLVLV